MLMVGLTGGIGAGKSEVARRLAELGAVLIDADALAREVVAPGSEGLAEVREAFGDGVLGPDGALDRPALGRIVFGDDALRRRLEAIIHPRVRARAGEIIAAARPESIIVNDVPLLVEAGLAGGYDLVVVVLAAEETRIARLRHDRGMSEAEARARIAAQVTDEQRRAVAAVMIMNDGTLDELRSAVDAAWQARILPLARARDAGAAKEPDASVATQRATRDGR
jgi:dephospho-CoA kinase